MMTIPTKERQMAYQFKVGDTGKTRDGRPYRVIATDLTNSRPIAAAIAAECGREALVSRDANGQIISEVTTGGDLIPPASAVYINVYEREDGTRWASAAKHDTRKIADERSGQLFGSTRVGCIRVELEARFDD
jgi:hypothetical protein